MGLIATEEALICLLIVNPRMAISPFAILVALLMSSIDALLIEFNSRVEFDVLSKVGWSTLLLIQQKQLQVQLIVVRLAADCFLDGILDEVLS